MTTGPRNTPHPIILHVDDQGNPVRLAEASSIYVTAVSAVSISATNYLGLNINSPGVPVGESTEIQFRKSATEFDGDTSLTYDKQNQRLNAIEIVVGDLSATTNIFSEEIITAVKGFSGASVTATNAFINTISATTVSAVTVCATNYNSLFDSLSFTNLDSRYLNSSGDSVTGSFYIQNVSSVSLSATNYLNLPSSLATWNASAIRGIPVTSTLPGLGETLVYKDGVWQPSAIAGGGGGTVGGTAPGAIQFKNGAFFSGLDTLIYNESISGIQSIGLSSTNLSSVNIRVTTISATTYNNIGESTAKWNANQIQGFPVSKPGSVAYKDIIAGRSIGGAFEKADITVYGGWVYDQIKSTIHAELPQTNASAIRSYTVTSTAPSSSNVLMYNGSVWAPSSVLLRQLSDTTGISTASGGQVLIYSSSVNKWQPGYKIYQSSSNPTNTIGVNGDIYFQYTDTTGTYLSSLDDVNITNVGSNQVLAWNSNLSKWAPYTIQSVPGLTNASSLLGGAIIAKEASGPGTTLGALVYIYSLDTYQAVPLNSSSINGTKDIFTNPSQGAIVASYLGSASEYFELNPYWNSPGLVGIGTYPGYPDIPKNDDVLIFTDNLYNKAQLGFGAYYKTKAWTWKSLSLSSGVIKDVDTDGAVANQILSYDGSKWSFSSTAQLSNVSATSGIFTNVTGTNSTLTNVTATNSTLTNVTATNATITSEVVTSATINNIKTTRHAWTRKSIPISAGNLSIDLSQGQIFDVTLSANITSISVSSPYPGTVGQEFTLIVKYNANSSGKTIQWNNGTNTSINWSGGTAGPTLSLLDGELDIFKFITIDNGVNWYAYIIGQSYIIQ